MDNREAVAALVDALTNTPDPAVVNDLIADDAWWDLKGRGVDYARRYNGKPEIFFQYLAGLMTRIDPEKSVFNVIDVFHDDEQNAAVVHYEETLQTKTTPIIGDVVMLIRLREGQIISITEVMDLRPVVEAFGTSWE